MKKTFKTMLALMAGAMTFTGCTSDILENTPEQIPSALKPMTFTATQESDATRAAIVGTAINWTTGDKISIFDGSTENDGNQEFTLTGEAGKPSGTFEGSAATASTYYALYPYASSSKTGVPTREEAVTAAGTYEMYFGNWEAMWGNDRVVGDINAAEISQENKAIILAYFNNESITTKSGLKLNAGKIEGVTFPAAQTATTGTADPKAMLMIGTSDGTNNIQFKNVCAYLKVTPTFACSSIVLKSNGTESLAGTVTLGLDTDGVLTTTVTAGTNTVTLSGTIAANSTYYIAVLPATLATGFTVEFKDASDKVIGSKSTTKSVPIVRNKVINLGSFNMYPPEGSTGKATRTGGSEVNWVQLWEDGPKFAEYNIGATSAIEYNCGHYCWGRSVDQEKPGVLYDSESVLTGEDDTATKLWGSNWRMPAEGDISALLNKDNCTVQWTVNYKGTDVNGLLCTGKGAYAANSIFLPATASCNDGNVLTDKWGEYGNYWTSTPVAGNTAKARYLHFRSDWHGISPYDRTRGFAIRPVLNEATKGTAKATINSVETDVNWVQLWKDGPKFAEYNVGATSENVYGSHIKWADDIASTKWGSAWRLPTSAELQALIDNCTCDWTTVNDVPGRKYTGEGDYASNSIFLPAAGNSYYGDPVKFKNELGDYWSSTPFGGWAAYCLEFSSSGHSITTKDYESFYLFVRAVLK